MVDTSLKIFNHTPLSDKKRKEQQDKLINRIYPLLEGYTIQDINEAFKRIEGFLVSYQIIGKAN